MVDLIFRCSKCKFQWIVNYKKPEKIKKLYESNKRCPKCGKEDVELLIRGDFFEDFFEKERR